jgi:hypothetical protein
MMEGERESGDDRRTVRQKESELFYGWKKGGYEQWMDGKQWKTE